MAITSADVTAVLGLGYPIGFVTIYLAASIIFKVREVRGDSNARPQNTAAGREKVVFCLLCFFCIELVSTIKSRASYRKLICGNSSQPLGLPCMPTGHGKIYSTGGRRSRIWYVM
jgi:hypothetical protein